MTDPFAPPTSNLPLYGEPLTTGRAPRVPGMPGAPVRNGLGRAAVIVGTLALIGALLVVPGVLLGLVAVLLGGLGLRRVRLQDADNRGQALAGLILGLIAVAASITIVVLALSSDAGRRWVDCIDASGDQAAQTVCNEAFARELVGQ